MFGPDRGAVDSPEMNRLFKSTMELGFLQVGEAPSVISLTFIYEMLTSSILALDKAVREARERGTDVERDCEGLPTSLRMPSPVILSPTSNASLRTVPLSPAIEAKGEIQSAQIEFMAALDLSGRHAPELIIPDQFNTSHEEATHA